MSPARISEALRRVVETRAGSRCEYCLLPTSVAFYPHEVDHIIARKHGGESLLENLALACWRCNRHKGSDLTSFDPDTGALTLLFSPRNQRWPEHLALEAGLLIGLSAEGRTTLRLLQLNNAARIDERLRLLAVGLYVSP